MYANDTIGFYDVEFKKRKTELLSEIVLDTIGDRILYLLRTSGRSDRGVEYEQQELAAWLSGEEIAPNGKKYNFKLDRSYVNRLVGNKPKRYEIEILSAICDIFGVDLEWLGRGKTIEVPDEQSDIFIAPEAGKIALLMERMEVENRQTILYIAERISRLDNELRQSDYEVAKILARNIDVIPAPDRSRARLLLAQISANRRPPGDLGFSAK